MELDRQPRRVAADFLPREFLRASRTLRAAFSVRHGFRYIGLWMTAGWPGQSSYRKAFW
jgi:hypothetical protein